MRAMLLAAGLGRRLAPLTDRYPKPTIPVLGRPMLLQQLARLERAGCDRVVINEHHLGQVIRQTVARSEYVDGPMEILFSHEPVLLGTAGGLRNVADQLRGDGPILVLNADFVSDIDIRWAYDAHMDSDAAATLVTGPRREGYSNLDVDGLGRVHSIAGEPPTAEGVSCEQEMFTGCHVLDESLLERIPFGMPCEIVPTLYRPLAAEGRLGSVLHRGFWWDVGSPRAYLDGSLQLMAALAEQELEIGEHDGIHHEEDALVCRGAGADVDSTATLRGQVAVGFATRVGEESFVENSILMPETWVGPRCRLTRCVVTTGVELPAGFEMTDGWIVADDGIPPADRGNWRQEGTLAIRSLAPET
ncbi:MAG: sugar phosphate nucleotidyltransferase [Acidobacteriota bacterium]|nr:sugar phosphate nucleotidyltransferase [Acidobacteriota bacterium]MDH3784194.1 sugar phosphate nucleotidyltransferase [Acidobacteriota bacterium]